MFCATASPYLFLGRPLSLLLLVLLELRRGEHAVVALAEEEVLQLLVVVERPLQLLQLGHVLLRVLLVAILRWDINDNFLGSSLTLLHQVQIEV